MKARMTKRERVEATMEFRETDQIPLYDLVRNDGMIEHFYGSPVTMENKEEAVYAAIRESMDMTRSIGFPAEPRAYTDEETGFRYRVERWTSWIAERPFRDVDGLREWVKADILRKTAWSDENALAEEFRARFMDKQAGIGDDTVILLTESGVGLDYAFHCAGLELFTYLLADEPELVSEWLEAAFQHEVKRVKVIADPGLSPVALTFGDIAFKGSTLFSPDFLRREFFPRLKQLNDVFHNAGIKCLFHSDGYLMDVLEDIVTAGCDGLNPIETTAGMSVKEVREKAPKLFIAGGIDVSQLLPFGTVEEVRETVHRTIEDAGGVGIFVGSTTELDNGSNPANILAMIDAARGYR